MSCTISGDKINPVCRIPSFVWVCFTRLLFSATLVLYNLVLCNWCRGVDIFSQIVFASYKVITTQNIADMIQGNVEDPCAWGLNIKKKDIKIYKYFKVHGKKKKGKGLSTQNLKNNPKKQSKSKVNGMVL